MRVCDLCEGGTDIRRVVAAASDSPRQVGQVLGEAELCTHCRTWLKNGAFKEALEAMFEATRDDIIEAEVIEDSHE